ncbi:MAG: DUF5654 family protein [Candidatus Nanoarchaeia archaeon]
MGKLKLEVVEKLNTLITAGFGLVAALAWNTAIQSWFERQKVLKIGGPLIYAVFVTVIAVLITIWMGRVTGKVKEREEAAEKRKEEK